MAVSNAPRGIARLSRRLVSLSGRDAADFLQGMLSAALLTRDGAPVHRPPYASAAYAGLFTPNGRVLNDMIVYPRPPADASQAKPDYVLEVDGGEASRLARRFSMYKLRSKFNMRVLDPAEMAVFHLWDDAATEKGVDGLRSGLAEGDVLCEDPRVPGLGYRALVAGGKTPRVGLDEVGEDSYRLRRYLHGVAEDQHEIPAEKALPLEFNMELMRGVSFEKGCYVGQELQARTRYLGVVQKRVLPCVLYDGDAAPQALEYKPVAENGASAEGVEAGAAIVKMPREGAPPPGARDRKPGKWIAGVGNVGLAVCRLAAMTDIVPPHPPDMEVELKYAPEDQFKVAAGDGKEVKVKAFAPEWLRKGLVGYRG